MKLNIKEIKSIDEAPMDLLLLADPSEELIREYLSKGICYTAEKNGQLVGVILIVYKIPDNAEVMNIAVKEEFQKQGIGREILTYIQKELKNKGVKALEIGTGNSSIFQLLLYQRCGFRITKIDFDFFRKNYPEPIYENGIECRDMLRLTMEL